jgi:phosphoserine phosphatase RsbU/P
MDKNEISLMKKKYRNNYITRLAWSVLMLVIVLYYFKGILLVMVAVHLGLSVVWIALVEFKSPLMYIENLRFFRITMDVFLYTLAIYITGGAYSFCFLSYILFVMLASLYSTKKYGIFAIVLSVASYNLMLLLIYQGYLRQINILAGEEAGYGSITATTVLFTNFFLVFVSIIMHLAANTLYRNLMDRTSELQVERNRLRDRNLIIEKDIKLARRIQEQLIPQKSPYPFIHTLYKPMDQVGGDFFDFLGSRNSSRIGIFLSDVSGHGVPAAFITSMVKTMILQSGLARENPCELLTYLNGLLNGKTADNFITAFYGIYDTSDRTLVYSNAGHNPPYRIADNGVVAIGEALSIPLAIADNEYLAESGLEYKNFQRVLSPGDRLLFYTDGLTEEKGKEDTGNTFEELMLKEILPGQKGRSARTIVEGLHLRLEEWSGSKSFKDDVCIICLEVN